MAYRFSDTSKWNDEWFVDLTPQEKLLFLYLCDNCDIAGFYELSTRKLSFDTSLSADEVKGALKGLERAFILSEDRRILFLKKFVKHQKNLPLNALNKSHKGILSRFENYKSRFSTDLVLLVNEGISPLQKAEFKPLLRGSGNGNGNIHVEVNNKGVDFENFWNLYDKKVGDKARVGIKWNKLAVSVQELVLKRLPEWKKQFTDKQFQPHPETYINQQRWNDEIIVKFPKQDVYIPSPAVGIDHTKFEPVQQVPYNPVD